MAAPEVEVTAWWSLSNVDRYRFVKTDPGRSRLTFTDGVRRYETPFGDVTERVDEPTVPPVVRRELVANGYRVSVGP